MNTVESGEIRVAHKEIRLAHKNVRVLRVAMRQHFERSQADAKL